MGTLHLLINNHYKVHWGRDRDALVAALAEHPQRYCCQEVIDVALSDQEQLALATLVPAFEADDHVDVSRVPDSYYQAAQEFLRNPPQWHAAEGCRIYVLFHRNGEAVFSPSGNNLNSFYAQSPDRYACPAVRVSLTPTQYVAIDGYWVYICDNF